MVIQENRKQDQVTPQDDDWTLTSDQMLFMLQHHNAIEDAYASDNMDFLRNLAGSNAYKTLFGDMPWDEAYDRYESMLED